MDIAQQCHEVWHIIYRLALEAVLEQVAGAAVLLVVVDGVHNTQMLDGATYILLIDPQQQVYVVRHQAVGVERAEWWQAVALLVVLLQHLCHATQHPRIVFPIFKNILPVNAAKHHMVDTSA